MRLFNFVKLVLLLSLINLFGFSLNAQQNLEIYLLDQESHQPIQEATFEYGSQSGISDEKGMISFQFTAGKVMTISHLNYGTWVWDEQTILNLSKEKTYHRRKAIMDLYPVTVIAVKAPQYPREEVAMDYQDKLAHDGASVLNQIPAINSIRKSGSYGFDPVFRGFKYDQLNVVLDGAQSATAACPNRMDPPTSQMAPNMMDRIEVLKGPHALRFGTGFGGTINFVPTPFRFTENAGAYGSGSSEYQSNGRLFRNEGQIGLNGSKYDLRLFGAWSQGADYESGNGQIVQSDFSRASFGAKMGLKIAKNQQLSLSALYNRARDVDFPALPMDLRDDDTWMFNARHDISFDEGTLKSWNTTIFASFVDHLMDNQIKPLDPRMMNASTAAETHNYGGRTEGIWYFNHAKLYTGADIRVEGAQGIRERAFLMGPNAGKSLFDNAWQEGQIQKTALFSAYHLETVLFNYVFSGRISINQSEIKDPSNEFTTVFSETNTTQINPSLSIGILKKLNSNTQIGLWLGRAQRSGSLTERYINYFPVGQDPYEMLGNPNLAPEVNNQADLTFEWRRERARLNVDVFVAYLQDYISSTIDTTISPKLPNSPGVRRFENIDQALKAGFEMNWVQELGLGLRHQIGLAYTYAQDLVLEEPLPEIPPLDLNYALKGNYLKGKLKPEATFRHVLKQSRVSSQFGESETPAFTLLDLKVSYQVFKRARFSVGVNNLLDENYYEHLSRSVRGLNQPIFERGRNFFASINIAFD